MSAAARCLTLCTRLKRDPVPGGTVRPDRLAEMEPFLAPDVFPSTCSVFCMTRLTVIPGGRSAVERFETLVGRHYQLLYRAAYRLTRSVPDAEDLVQEVCVRAYPRLEQLEQLDQPQSWLLCVMRRIFIDQLRRFERTNVESIEIHDSARFATDRPEPPEETEAAQWASELDRAWQQLDEDQRSLLALHDVEGYTLAELMEMTGLKEGTIKSRLHRARAKLGKLLNRARNEPQSTASRAGGRR